MIYKTVSVKQVIAKILTDNNIQEETHRIPDMVDWCGEALEKIGAFPQFETVVTGKESIPLLRVLNYQAQLPLGLHNIIQVAYTETGEAPYYPVRYATGSFDSKRGITTVIDDTDPNNIIYGTKQESPNETGFSGDLVYTINSNYIKLNVPEGYLMLAYTSIPLDSDGYPLVPDDISFLDALYWYVTMKLLYPKWAEGRIRDAVYYDARSSWNFYRKQAYGNALMPNSDQLTAIKNTWNRLVPELNEENTFFSTLGQEQLIYNKNGKSYVTIQ